MGILSQGAIEKNSSLYIGPYNDNTFKNVKIISIHCKKIEVKKVFKGQYCTIEVDLNENNIRKGMVIVNKELTIFNCKRFEVELWNIDSKDVKIIEKKTHFVISSGPIRQEGIVIKSIDTVNFLLNNQKEEQEGLILKPEEPIKLEIEFCYNREFLKEGNNILIFDSSIKCFGVVKKLLS